MNITCHMQQPNEQSQFARAKIENKQTSEREKKQKLSRTQ